MARRRMAKNRPRRGRKVRRAFRRYGRKGGAKTVTVRGVSGIPDRMRVKLIYAENISVGPGTPVFDQVYRGNSVFDPDLTGVGHQPHYFDQYATLYSRYRVHSSSIRVDCINQSGVMAVSVVVVPTSDVGLLTSIGNAVEQRRSVFPKMIPIAQRGSVVCKDYCTTRKAAGLTAVEMAADDVWAAAVTANPAQQWYWHILMESTDQITLLIMQLQVRITYYVEFYDSVLVGPS